MTEPPANSAHTDPFPTDAPIAPSELVGRADEVAGLVAALEDSQHQIVVGADKAGKTSVANAVAAQLRERGWGLVPIDLFHTTGASALAAALSPASATTEAGEQPPSIAAAVSALDESAKQSGRRTLVYIDSFHELATTHMFGKVAKIGAELRHAFDASEQLAYLIVGGASTVMRKLFGSKDEPFHRFGELTTLSPIAAEDWQAELPARVASAGLTLTPDGSERLLDLSEGHARSTMLLAKHACAVAQARGLTEVEPATIDVALQSALLAERPLAEVRIAQVRGLSKHALTTAMRVAAKQSPYKNLPPAMARQTLRGLESAGIVDHPKSGVYSIADPMLRHYLFVLGRDGALPDPADLAVDTPVQVQLAATEPTIDATPIVDDAVAATDDHPIAPTGVADATSAGSAAPVHPGDTAVEADTLDAAPPARQLAPSAADPATVVRGEPLIRQPEPAEADAVADSVARAAEAESRRLAAIDGSATALQAARTSASRLGRLIRAAVDRHPDTYWQAEIADRAIGGVVLRRPGRWFTRDAFGINPVSQAVILGVTLALSIAGIVSLAAQQAWTWGAYSGIIFAALIAAIAHVVMLAPRAVARAGAALEARRTGGQLVEAIWSEPEAMQEMFRALAQTMPGTPISAYVESPERERALRDLGFCVRRRHVLTGVLDPTTAQPLRSVASTTVDTPDTSPMERSETPNVSRPGGSEGRLWASLNGSRRRPRPADSEATRQRDHRPPHHRNSVRGL